MIVTGGAGFIGSHVSELFLTRDYEVVVIDDLSTGFERNVPAEARFEQIDIVDAQAVDQLVAEVAPVAICHLAAQSTRRRPPNPGEGEQLHHAARAAANIASLGLSGEAARALADEVMVVPTRRLAVYDGPDGSDAKARERRSSATI